MSNQLKTFLAPIWLSQHFLLFLPPVSLNHATTMFLFFSFIVRPLHLCPPAPPSLPSLSVFLPFAFSFFLQHFITSILLFSSLSLALSPLKTLSLTHPVLSFLLKLNRRKESQRMDHWMHVSRVQNTRLFISLCLHLSQLIGIQHSCKMYDAVYIQGTARVIEITCSCIYKSEWMDKRCVCVCVVQKSVLKCLAYLETRVLETSLSRDNVSLYSLIFFRRWITNQFQKIRRVVGASTELDVTWLVMHFVPCDVICCCIVFSSECVSVYTHLLSSCVACRPGVLWKGDSWSMGHIQSFFSKATSMAVSRVIFYSTFLLQCTVQLPWSQWQWEGSQTTILR